MHSLYFSEPFKSNNEIRNHIISVYHHTRYHNIKTCMLPKLNPKTLELYDTRDIISSIDVINNRSIKVLSAKLHQAEFT